MTDRWETARRLSESGEVEEARAIAVEAPVAVEFNGIGYAVMMMTPADLPAFALGFSLTERIARGPEDVIDTDVATAKSILGEVEGKAVGVVKTERRLPVELPTLHKTGARFVEQPEPSFQVPLEACFLQLQGLGDQRLGAD